MNKILLLVFLLSSQLIHAQDDWQTIHHKYGFTIQLPKYFTIGSLTASGLQYYHDPYALHLMLAIEAEGKYNNVSDARNAMTTDYAKRLTTTEGVKYKILKDDMFVISGQNSDGYFYQKWVIKNNKSYFLMISYPPSEKKEVDKILLQISDSFD